LIQGNQKPQQLDLKHTLLKGNTKTIAAAAAVALMAAANDTWVSVGGWLPTDLKEATAIK
jgi:NaMN:DMB phosphoribosyltransferase